ncbi:MAG: hypothetical protein RJA63_723 [Pseudomonadota bacterium]|jgi:hypothetical protein|nr:hypothetical protein [Uliginosibacterium sp.]
MRRTSPVSIYLDPEMKAYLQQIAGSRRMTLSDFCMHLMVKGLVSDELEQGVERIKDVFNGIASDAVLREVLAVRYLLERHIKGEIRTPATVGYDANQYAERELAKRAECKPST